MSTTPQSGTRVIHLILAWSFVGIPFAWGVLQTLRNALNLFR
ncbi:MAG: MFS transporter small subunit [Steroidobacteraceae bacterium]